AGLLWPSGGPDLEDVAEGPPRARDASRMSGSHSPFTQPAHSPATPLELAIDDFVAEFKRWREVRGVSQKRLAREMGYDASYVSKIESGHQAPTRDFARRADEVMQAGGGLVRRWSAFATARAGSR